MADPIARLPKHSIQRAVHAECSDSNANLSPEVFDLLNSCCVEFIQLVTAQANEQVLEDKKMRIAPKYILSALTELGYEDFSASLGAEYVKEKQLSQKRKSKAQIWKEKRKNMSEEELIRQQEELFKKAREKNEM